MISVGGAVIELDKARLGEAVDLLVAAFADDPGYRHFANAARSDYRHRLRLWFREGTAVQEASGQPVLGVLDGGQLAGVAVIQAPGASFPVLAQVRWLLTLSWQISPLTTWRTYRNMRATVRCHPADPHYYLPILGVHPNHQGKGFGRLLLDELHARSERHPASTGVCLETENPANVAMYRHFGYRVTHRLTVGRLPVTVMFRPNGAEKPGPTGPVEPA